MIKSVNQQPDIGADEEVSTHRRRSYTVEIDGKEVAGNTVTYAVNKHGVAEILNFDVKREYSGKGIETALYRQHERDMRSQGVSRLFLSPINSRAGHFWERMGFKLQGDLMPKHISTNPPLVIFPPT